tara:strand:+ start:345 stop:650 length:306 start_codon:yes stop_codon:yes gene_type:complete
MILNKIILLILTLFFLSCSSSENLSKKIFSNPEDGITIYDEEIDVGLKATGGKVLKRHLEQAKKHCNLFDKNAIYVTSGAIEQGLTTNKYRTYEEYKCVKA